MVFISYNKISFLNPINADPDVNNSEKKSLFKTYSLFTFLWFLYYCLVKSSQVTFIYIALLTIQIVTKQLQNIKMGK